MRRACPALHPAQTLLLAAHTSCWNVELLREHSAEEGTDTTSVTKESPCGRVRQDGACIRWASCQACSAMQAPRHWCY
eukprot:64263-Chlamydomonas_euryale.AAC.1